MIALVLAAAILADAAASTGTPLTPAEEDAYFDLDKPFVQQRDIQLNSIKLTSTPNAAENCAKTKAFVELDQTEVAALTQYLEDLQARGRSIDLLLRFYLVSVEREDHDEAGNIMECAYDGKKADVDALEQYVTGLLNAVPAKPSDVSARTVDLALLRTIMRRDVMLDEAVSSLEILRDAGASSTSAKALVAQLDALKAEQQAARQERIDRLTQYEDNAASDSLMFREMLRATVR